MDDIFIKIEAARKEAGVKQEVLAKMLGVTQGTYSGYLTQNQDIKYGLLLDIANKLNMSVIDIITWPQKYVPKSDTCDKCKEKDDIIKNLNNYIKLLTK